MGTILKNELRRTRKGLLIWCLITGLVAYLGILEYPILAPYTAQMESALAMIPKLGQLVFGVYNVSLREALGYYIVMYYWTGLIVFTHAVYTGASMLPKESRDKTAEFLLTKPYPRSVIVWAKLLAGLCNILVLGVVTVALSLSGMVQATGDLSLVGAVLLSGVGLLATQLVLMLLGFLCGAVGRTYRSGVALAATVLLVSYCLMFFIQYVDRPDLGFLSPLTFFSVSEVTAGGLSPVSLLLSVIVAALCVALIHRLYRKKVMVL